MRTSTLALALTLLAGCHDHDDCDDCGGSPVFVEDEPNDAPLDANSFGVLRSGDHFFIEGFVRDDAGDPFDGFAFTAGEDIHVDFQLFNGDLVADLDVCLYDPLLDETLACFATNIDPERGGVEVFAGFDFHLVIESFVGDGDYTLEIVVLPLFAALAGEDGEPARAGVRAAPGAGGREGRAATDYRRARPAERPLVRVEEHLWLDQASGTALLLYRRTL
jgi:hypothetical protein